MEFEHCFGCMAHTKEYPCPFCGFDPAKQERQEDALKLGTILKGRYAVGAALARSGGSITYVGWDLALERKIALREYFPIGQASRRPGRGCDLQWDTSVQAETARTTGMDVFRKEAETAARLGEIPQIARIWDVFEENETAYIVMDFVEGETIGDRLKRTGPLSWEESKKRFFSVIETMEKVHQAGQIHQGLCPDSLMLQTDGTVKILSPDCPKGLQAGCDACSIQETKSGFSPPELYIQMDGSGTWTDVYAMAATLYCALTGKIPPSAVDRMEEDTTDWILLQRRDIPGNVSAALQKAMILKAGMRTQTMAEFLKDLQSGSGKRRFPFTRK